MEFIGMTFIIGCFVYLSWYAIGAFLIGLGVIGLVNEVPSEHIPVIKHMGVIVVYIAIAITFLSIFI